MDCNKKLRTKKYYEWINVINPFHATCLFLCPPENIRKPLVFYIFRSYRKRALAWNGLKRWMKATNSTPSSYFFLVLWKERLLNMFFIGPLKMFTSFWCFKGYRKRPMTWNGVKKEVKVDSNESTNQLIKNELWSRSWCT